MIPLRDVIPSRTTPYITVTIIVLNALAWFFELSLPRDVLPRFLQVYGVVPARLHARRRSSRRCSCTAAGCTSSATCGTCGSSATTSRIASATAASSSSTCCAASPRRSVRSLIDPTSTLPTIGASGAIAGVMGAYFVLYPQLARADARSRSSFFWEIIELPAIVLLGFWFLMQLFSAGAIAVTASTERRRRRVHGARRRLRRRGWSACSSSGSASGPISAGREGAGLETCGSSGDQASTDLVSRT